MDSDIYNDQYLKPFFEVMGIDVDDLRNMKARVWRIDAFDENNPLQQDQLWYQEQFVMSECWGIEAELMWAAYLDDSTFPINLFHGKGNIEFIISAIEDLCQFLKYKTGQAEHYEPRRYSIGAMFAPEVPVNQMESFLLEKFEIIGKKRQGFHTVRAFAENHLKGIKEDHLNAIHEKTKENLFAEVVETFPVVAMYTNFLREVAEGRELSKPAANIGTPPQESEDGTGAEIEPILTDTRETVVNILDPLEEAFVTRKDFDEAVNRVCGYFDGELQQGMTPIRVRRGKWKALGKALGDIHKDIKNLDPIGRDYLQFAKDTFDCFAAQDISGERLRGITLYKYMKEKRL